MDNKKTKLFRFDPSKCVFASFAFYFLPCVSFSLIFIERFYNPSHKNEHTPKPTEKQKVTASGGDRKSEQRK